MDINLFLNTPNLRFAMELSPRYCHCREERGSAKTTKYNLIIWSIYPQFI